MRHQPAEGGRIRRGVDGQDDPVGAGIRPGVHGAARQDGELVQVAAGAVGEGEAFAVVVGVGVLAPPYWAVEFQDGLLAGRPVVAWRVGVVCVAVRVLCQR